MNSLCADCSILSANLLHFFWESFTPGTCGAAKSSLFARTGVLRPTISAKISGMYGARGSIGVDKKRRIKD